MKNSIAAFAVYREIYGNNDIKNTKEVLKIFIDYILEVDNITVFSSKNIKDKLNEYFEFEIPIAVIEEVFKILIKEKKIEETLIEGRKEYIKANKKDIKEEITLNTFNNKEERIEIVIISRLFNYLDGKGYKYEKERIKEKFKKVILENDIEDIFTYEINKFIMENSKDNEFVEQIEEIKQGYIIYQGLTYNILEKEEIKTKMQIFLDEEILFYLNGYNGDEYKEYVEDLMFYINEANKNKVIELKYFDKTKIEVEKLFNRAKDIKAGKTVEKENASEAIKKILNETESSADVIDKEDQFFNDLSRNYNISEVEESFDEELHKYDLHYSMDFEDDIFLRSPEDLDYYKSCMSNINKIRKGDNSNSFCNTQAFFVSGSTDAFILSKAMQGIKELNVKNRLIYSISEITSLFWNITNQGYRKNLSFPKNTTSILNVKFCLKNLIDNSINKVYDETIKKYESKEITEKELIKKLAIYKKKRPKNLSDISSENIKNYDILYKRDIDAQIAEYESMEKNIKKLKYESKQKDYKIEQLNDIKDEKEKKIDQIKKENEIKNNLILKNKRELERIKSDDRIKNVVIFILILIIIYLLLKEVLINWIRKFFIFIGPLKISNIVEQIIAMAILAIIGAVIKFIYNKIKK